MEKVEEDLTRSKSVRERQAKDFSEQLDALRHKYEQQVRIPVRAPLSAGACMELLTRAQTEPWKILPLHALLLHNTVCVVIRTHLKPED